MLVQVGIILALVLAVALIVGICEWHRGGKYRQSHPPISDEEFVKLCPPDTPPLLAIRVRTILAEFAGCDREEIYPDTRFIEDLHLG